MWWRDKWIIFPTERGNLPNRAWAEGPQGPAPQRQGPRRGRARGQQAGAAGTQGCRGLCPSASLQPPCSLPTSSFMLIHAHSCSFMLIHAHSCSFMLIHAHSCSFMLIHWCGKRLEGWRQEAVRVVGGVGLARGEGAVAHGCRECRLWVPGCGE
jgi:hypothetical protein